MYVCWDTSAWGTVGFKTAQTQNQAPLLCLVETVAEDFQNFWAACGGGYCTSTNTTNWAASTPSFRAAAPILYHKWRV